jgi:lysophospholipase L1-like esterase
MAEIRRSLALPKEKKYFVILSLFTVGICALILFAGECILRWQGTVSLYCERTKMECVKDENESLSEPWVWTWAPNQHTRISTGEFVQDIQLNKEGLTGSLPTPGKMKGEKRILFLGDSFTFGIGATEGPGWVETFASLLHSRSEHYRVLNGGVPGSDPVFELELLKRKLLKYHPDLVVVVINSSDLSDLMYRGGESRFTKRGRLNKPKTTVLQRLAFRSHLVRAFLSRILGYSADFYLSQSDSFRLKEDALANLMKTFARFETLSHEHGFQLKVLALPTFSEFGNYIGCYLWQSKEALERGGIPVFDLYSALDPKMQEAKKGEMAWPLDGHYTSRGYKLIGEAVDSLFREKNLIP